jgi:DnaJ-class molecular chaperone
MTNQRPTPYERLGVLPQASPAEITSAYRRLLRRHHPDSRDSSPVTGPADRAARQDAADVLGPIIEAYALLHDPRTRAEYDRMQGTSKPTAKAPRAAANPDLLLGAGPVTWSQESWSASRPAKPTITQQQAMQELLRIVRSRLDRW